MDNEVPVTPSNIGEPIATQQPDTTPTRPVRPGGPLQGRPIQGQDGQWFNQFGERIPPPDPTSTSETPVAPEVVDPDVAMLKGLSERCMLKHEGTYTNTLLGTDPQPELGRNRPYLDMTEAEGAAVERLVVKAQDAIARYEAAEPLWDQLQAALKQRRDIVGPLYEEASVIEDPSVTSITLIRDGLEIRVPPAVRATYLWGNKIGTLREDLRLIRAGLAEGRMAKPFGQDIYQVHSFLKQTSQ